MHNKVIKVMHYTWGFGMEFGALCWFNMVHLIAGVMCNRDIYVKSNIERFYFSS